MDAIEKAIRNALEKGDAQDRAFREKVYRSAFAALQRSLDANPDASPAVAEHRKRALSSRIEQIESEYVPALAPDAPIPAVGSPVRREPAMDRPADPAPRPNPPHPARPAGRTPVGDDGLPVMDPRDRAERAAPAETRRAATRPVKGRRKQRSIANVLTGIVLFLVLAAAVGYGGWFVMQSGLLNDQSASAPARQAADDDTPAVATGPASSGMVEDIGNWINVFRPSDLAQISAPGGGSAEATEREGEQLVRVRSADGAPVSFEIGAGVLEQLAGRRVVFNIVARAQEEADTQISVACDFGALGDCGRRRFQVGQARQDYLFEIGFPNQQPAGSGVIAINTDMEGEGRAIDIYAIRVSIGD